MVTLNFQTSKLLKMGILYKFERNQKYVSANVDSQSECKHCLESRNKCLYLQPLVGIPLWYSY